MLLSTTAIARRARRTRRGLTLALVTLGPGIRRAVDIVAAGAGLILLSPLLLAAAVAIRIESRGPVLFDQLRGGHRGAPFRMWKLRTMVADAEATRERLVASVGGARFKMRRDPRITRVGRVLRKLSVDELPQLYNVLRGDMTLIGPRPAPISECALYSPRALRRMEVRPGLTCLWQVGGRSDLSFDEQVELDLEYIDRSRLADDLRILIQTVPAVLTGRGAY